MEIKNKSVETSPPIKKSTTFYLDVKTGDDAADGSVKRPFKTIARATRAAYVHDGIWPRVCAKCGSETEKHGNLLDFKCDVCGTGLEPTLMKMYRSLVTGMLYRTPEAAGDHEVVEVSAEWIEAHKNAIPRNVGASGGVVGDHAAVNIENEEPKKCGD